MIGLTEQSVQRDIAAVSSAIDFLRETFVKTDNADMARTIITLMDTKDHLIQFQTMILNQQSSSEPVIDVSDNYHD